MPLIDLLVLVVIFLSLVVSIPLMYVLGIDYVSDTGSLIEKIHISTTLAMLIFLGAIIATGKVRFSNIRAGEFFALLTICVYAISSQLVFGRPVTNSIVTFVTPVFVLYVLGISSSNINQRVYVLVGAVLFINSIMGIAELALGSTFLPTVAGSVLVHGETRSIGLIGHPLTSSFLTGLMLIYLVLSRLMVKFDWWSMVQIVVHSGALLAFGGRVALVSTIAIIAFYVVFDGNTIVRRTPFLKLFRRLLMVLTALIVGSAILFSGFADNTLSRFTDDQGSAETRIVALDIVRSLPSEAILYGVSSADRVEIGRVFGTEFGIEVTWIAWLVDYGLFVTLALVVLLFLMLRICLRGAQRYHWYMTAYFLLCITGSQGLGSKTLMLTWFVVIMSTFGKQRSSEAISRVSPASYTTLGIATR